MENASKALLIAAGIFFAILIISLLLVSYNRVSTYYQEKHNETLIAQTIEFNSQFENYNRKNIRGSDLLSLMNKVIDYNATQSYWEEKSYERIRVKITLGNTDILQQFKLEKNDGTSINEYLKSKITNTKNIGNNWSSDKELIAITGTPSNLISKAATEGGFSITDAQLQQLQSKIDNILIDETADDVRSIENRYYRANILEDILEWNDMNLDEKWKCQGETTTKMELIKEITSQYHQYTQFKRAYFDCTKVIYDTKTNRVAEMRFKLQVENDTVVFN